MLLRYENKITECGNKASKYHRRMDTKCMEQYLMRSVDNYTRWGWEWPNPLLQAEILIDEDEEGDEEIDVLLWCIILDFLIRKMLLKVTQFNKPPVSNSAPLD